MASLQIFYAPNDHRIQMTRIITLPERQHIVHHLRLWFDPFAKSHRGDFGPHLPPNRSPFVSRRSRDQSGARQTSRDVKIRPMGSFVSWAARAFHFFFVSAAVSCFFLVAAMPKIVLRSCCCCCSGHVVGPGEHQVPKGALLAQSRRYTAIRNRFRLRVPGLNNFSASNNSLNSLLNFKSPNGRRPL